MIDQDLSIINSQDCIRIPHIDNQQHITPFSPAKPGEIQISKFKCQMNVKFPACGRQAKSKFFYI
jgi:hypothetical protein